MHFTVKKEDLFNALNHVQSVVERRNAVPILSNVKITTSKSGSIELTTTDMDICIVDCISGAVSKEGIITIPAHTLFEIVRKIPNNTEIEFTLSSKESSLMYIRANSSEFNLPTLSADEFPSFEEAKISHEFKISSEVLKALFSKTRHAISNEETRYYLNGIYLHSVQSEEGIPSLRAIATDGHRLARAQCILPEGADEMPGIIIPKKTIGEVIKLLDDYSGEILVGLSQNKIVFNIGTSTLSSKLIDGKFPDYERVIPKNNDKYLEVERDNLTRSIDLVISVSNDKTRAVKFNIEPSKLTISATSELNGNASGVQEIEAKYDSADKVTIGFNSKYVLDSLGAIDGNTVKLSLSGNLGAVIAQDANDNNFLYILMPMQV